MSRQARIETFCTEFGYHWTAEHPDLYIRTRNDLWCLQKFYTTKDGRFLLLHFCDNHKPGWHRQLNQRKNLGYLLVIIRQHDHKLVRNGQKVIPTPLYFEQADAYHNANDLFAAIDQTATTPAPAQKTRCS